MLTQRAWLLGFVGFCFYLIAVVNTLPSFYYVLMWLAIGLLAASLGIAFLSLTGLDFSWKLARARGHALPVLSPDAMQREMEVAVIEATLLNRGSLNKTGILLDIYLRDESRAQDVWLGFLLEAIPAGQTISVALPLRDLRRGRYTLTRAQLVGSDVLGLFRTRRKIPFEIPFEGADTICVGPALLPSLDELNSGAGGRARQGVSRRARPGGGDELHGTRPYVVGDDLRHVHWKTTARTGDLVMREWEQVGQAATLVIWDGAAQSDWGQGAQSSAECALVLTASLLASFADHGLPCALAALGEEARFVANRGAGGVAGTLESQQLEILARARATRETSLSAALHRAWNGPQAYQSAILVSTSLAPDVVELARELIARNLRVRVVILDGAAWGTGSNDARFGGRKPRVPQQKIGDASFEVTSQAYQEQAQKLRGAGAEVVLCAPEKPEEVWRALQSALSEILGGATRRSARTSSENAPREALVKL